MLPEKKKNSEEKLSRERLTPEQLHRLEIVSERMFPCGGVNENIFDTPSRLAEHDLVEMTNGRLQKVSPT